jgi:hypothetical protein
MYDKNHLILHLIFLWRPLWLQNIKLGFRSNTIIYGVFMLYIGVHSWFTSCNKTQQCYRCFSTNIIHVDMFHPFIGHEGP